MLAMELLQRHPSPQRSATRMPTHFTMDTIIGEGWRCNPSLGAFFKQNLGPGFHFNAPTRDFIHTKPGKTLADSAICYQTSVRPGEKKPPIPPTARIQPALPRPLPRQPRLLLPAGHRCMVDQARQTQRSTRTPSERRIVSSILTTEKRKLHPLRANPRAVLKSSKIGPRRRTIS
jgi:hypothetical protein